MRKTTGRPIPDRAKGLSLAGLTATDLQAVEEAVRFAAEQSIGDQRVKERYTIPFGSCAILEADDAPEAAGDAMPMDLSCGGVGLLFGRYLGEGVKARITLFDLRGHRVKLGARCRWCHHVVRSFHVVGLQFDSQIDPKEFVQLPPPARGSVDADLAELATWLYALASRLRDRASVAPVAEELRQVQDALADLRS